MSCSRFGCRHHAGWAAVVEVSAGAVFAQCRGEIEPLGRVAAVVVELHPPQRGEDREIVEERRLLGRTGAVVQTEIGAAPAQFRDHRHDRRDADTAGDQQMVLRLGGQREIVARHRSLDDFADAHLLMPFAGSLPFRLSQHSDAIARAFGGIVVQREVAHRPVADPHRDMRPGREPGQIAFVRVHQLVAVDSLGQIDNGADAEQHAPKAQRATSPHAT